MRVMPLIAGFALLGLLAACGGQTAAPAQPAPATAAPAAGPSVGSATDVTSFKGARAGQAEGGLARLGYAPARTQGLTTWWLNSGSGACARMTTADGRFSDVRMVPVAECTRRS